MSAFGGKADIHARPAGQRRRGLPSLPLGIAKCAWIAEQKSAVVIGTNRDSRGGDRIRKNRQQTQPTHDDWCPYGGRSIVISLTKWSRAVLRNVWWTCYSAFDP